MSEVEEKEVTVAPNDDNEFLPLNKDELETKAENTPSIIANELLEPSAVELKSPEEECELLSLEREIAEMHHHVEPTASAVAHRVSDSQHGEEEIHQENVLLEMQAPIRNTSSAASGEQSPLNGETIENTFETKPTDDQLEHEDLIAVLKGIDEHGTGDDTKEGVTAARAPSTNESELGEGVLIEGEGSFQIMEVIDDEGDELLAALDEKPAAEQAAVAAPKIYPNVVAKLTREEERAMAMEQMAGLKNRSNERQRRRKQDIKPLALEGSDLVTSLGAEWSDDDTAQVGAPSPSAATVNTKANTSPKSKPSDAVPPVKSTESVAGETVEPKSGKSAPKVTNVAVLQSAKVKPAEENKTEVTAAPTPPPQVSTGFKRTRIIKRKIIWDPDETQFSYAALVRSSGKNKAETTSAKGAASPSTTATSKKDPPAKKEPAAKKVRPSTPKDKKLASSVALEAVEKKPPRSATPLKQKAEAGGKVTTATNVALSTKSLAAEESDRGPSPIKRRSQTPVANGAGAIKKKKISEIDRLMGDEGAVNMLNALESERGKASPETTSPDKPHKPLMRSRAATICERITKRDTTPTKKDLPAAPKNKRGPKQKASSSWDYVYKAQATDDAMIIRRRSNSSYSSTASLHRSSLDGPATPKVNTKSASASSTPASSTAASTPNSTTKSATKASPKSLNATNNSPAENSPIKSSAAAASSKLSSPKTFEFAKPESKSNQKQSRRTKSPSQPTNPLASDMKKGSSPSAAAGGKRAAVPSTVDKEKGTKSPSTKDETAAATSDVVVKKTAKVAQIVFNTHKAKQDHAFTAQMMNKLVDILDKLSTDKDCNAVVMTTNAPHFCQGIDFTDLTVDSADKRKQAAVQLATAVKNYLKTLATFPKPLIAGVNGHNIGLGVTQLPLFDIVIASDKSSFETPYAKIGQVPEGFCIWNNITKIRGTFKTKLFWLCEKLHSTESALSGLVNRLTASNKVNEDALNAAKKIAAMSAESYRVMKKATIHNHLDAIVSALDDEFDTIIAQWSGNECYENFKKYLEVGHL